MDSLKSLNFSSFIIFSDYPWSLLVSFGQLFKLPLVVQCCNVICEWPLTAVLSANRAPASAKTRPRQKLRFGDLAREIARSVLTIVLFDNERGGRWEGGEVPIS